MATGVHLEGKRKVLGIDGGASEDTEPAPPAGAQQLIVALEAVR